MSIGINQGDSGSFGGYRVYRFLREEELLISSVVKEIPPVKRPDCNKGIALLKSRRRVG